MSESVVTLGAGFADLGGLRGARGLLGAHRARRGQRLRRLGLRSDRGEGCRFVHRHVGEHLSIERHAGGFEAGHELAVRQAMLARGRIDANDPQRAEIAFLAATADERIFERRIDRFFCCAIQLALVRVITFSTREQLLPLRPSYCSSLNPRHSLLPRYPVCGWWLVVAPPTSNH